MPKKFSTENAKAAAARVRKEEAKAVATATKQKEVEDALWVEDDKNVLKKEQRKVEREKKRLEQVERKKEAQRLLDEEQASLKGRAAKQAAAAAAAAAGGGKVTRAQIGETLKREQEERAANGGSDGEGGVAGKGVTQADQPLEENINRLVAADDAVEARSVDDAIAALSTKENVDHHPERRMKAAYTAYEELHLPRLKKENPNMRLSQLKQVLKKDWMRSPENPMNQKHAAYNVKA
ncbi:coiled-coil domain-containing protein 124 [Lethenteron reissneri]|uniref:coiled-coil domain-containing protein 124 n=1 Tax=Lethenteron reissneri TaxID=7753 RepID=UPI002AB76654|nr:coiled-coil domain-containing protein 124 [Lethenteron reissneri]